MWSELVADLPDEDLGEDLEACLEDYEMGSKPRCEEAEYLALVQDAIDRIADGGRGSSKRKGRIHGGGAPWVRRGRFRAS
ncbi:hypothetical protein [Streptomyces minutiscleroticus]|uniref:hypothetical protein n=1 Tax=Streptomyces minutiscleroticus TaxID=68238 RepID=UPI00167D79E5|nr:hypothetical protein [Streptomyces minutiscleroticus]